MVNQKQITITQPGRGIIKPLAVLLLLSFFFVLHGYSENLLTIPVGEAVLLFLKYAAISSLLFGLLFLVTRSLKISTWFSILLWVYFFFFGSLHDAAKEVLPAIFSKYSVFVPITFSLVLCAAYLLLRSSIRGKMLTFLLLLFFIWIIVDLSVLTYKISGKTPIKIIPAAGNCADCDKPDVYLVVLDEYAGTAQLQNEMSFNNTYFEDSLRAMGFFVPKQPVSNYNYTPFSIASLLNMDYNEAKHNSYTHDDLLYCYQRVYKSSVVRSFLNNGYEFVNNSIFDIQGYSSPCNNTLLPSGADIIHSQTLIARLRRDVYFNFLRSYMPNSSLYKKLVFENRDNNRMQEDILLGSVKHNERPRFVYTHFIMPHFPYFFDSSGKQHSLALLHPNELANKKLYVGYLQYVNNKILEIVRKIESQSKQPPVILLLGDHGFRYGNITDLQFSTLAAIKLPAKNYQGYYDSISNVNQFRLLFAKMFRQELPLLPDKKIEVKN